MPNNSDGYAAQRMDFLQTTESLLVRLHSYWLCGASPTFVVDRLTLRGWYGHYHTGHCKFAEYLSGSQFKLGRLGTQDLCLGPILIWVDVGTQDLCLGPNLSWVDMETQVSCSYVPL